MFRCNLPPTLRPAVAPAALALLGLTCAAHSAKRAPNGKVVYVTKDTAVNSDISDVVHIGYANEGDEKNKKSPASPVVRIAVGGDEESVFIHNQSRVMVNGGKISVYVYLYDSGRLDLSGGSIGQSIFAGGSCKVNITGGSIGDALYAEHSSAINLDGGSVANDLTASEHATLNIRGGKFGNKIFVNDSSELNMSGTGLSKTLKSPATMNGGRSYSVYTLSGKLRDGSNVDGKTLLVLNKSKAKVTLLNAH